VPAEPAPPNLWDQIQTIWVMPEIERRQREGKLPTEFRIRRCLIKMPVGQPPIVEFNEEIHWLALVRKPVGIAFAKDDPIFISQIEQVETVNRPEVNGKPVAFIYIYSTGTSWKVVFDSSTNLPETFVQKDDEEWSLGKEIAESINLELRERVVGLHDALQQQIQAIGLWAAPALLPYPLSAIADHCRKDELELARKALVEHCTGEFLERLVGNWDSVPAFAARKQVFQDALSAHRDNKYTLSIPALVPHIEGVITDWIISKLPADAVKWKQESKTRQFKEVLTNGINHSFTDRRVIDAALSFIVDGPVLATFEKWILPDGAFPNRHVVGHGKFDSTIYTQENSIKVFLLLDSLRYVMEGHVTEKVHQ
jgi:hypothetical protein